MSLTLCVLIRDSVTADRQLDRRWTYCYESDSLCTHTRQCHCRQTARQTGGRTVISAMSLTLCVIIQDSVTACVILHTILYFNTVLFTHATHNITHQYSLTNATCDVDIAIPSLCPSICRSVCPSHAGIVSMAQHSFPARRLQQSSFLKTKHYYTQINHTEQGH